MDRNGNIHFGSLEEAERNRIRRGQNDDALSIGSETTVATTTIHFEKPKPKGDVIYEHSKESLEAKKKQEEMTKKLELQKKAKNIIVPTNENDVKIQLRELGHPITYFGETPADRRDRLKQLLSKILIETGSVPTFKKHKTHLRDEENEYFLYEGSAELKNARQEIAKYSLKEAAIRVEKNKIKKETIDPIEEEELIDRELEEIPKFEMSMCQFADPSCVSKGCFSPDTKYFATSGWSGLCKVWSIPDCNLKTTLLGHSNRAIDIQFSPFFGKEGNTSVSLATSGADNTVRLWPLQEEEEFQKSMILKGHEDRVNKVRFHPMGKHVISTSHDKTWKFWDIETKKELFTQSGHSKPVFACSVQPDGSLVFTGDCGGYGMLWDLRTGKSVLPLVGHVKQIISSDFNVNGYHIATGSDDNTVRFWDIRRKNCFNILPAHTKLISDVKFQPGKGRFLATASYDKTCKIWSSKDWTLTRTLIAHDSKVTSISLAEDMSYMASTSLDRKWMLWSKTKKQDGNSMIIE